ncbi:MAG: SRPBCC domain-containing protein [Bacteroidia bacterium]|nr:SRPBCC domain-containing protein [Bacteroidia bacterium]NNK60082.1 SRPBCC domain-containing protein [Flavobacteriaceae bacterium]
MKELQWHCFERQIYIHGELGHLYKLWSTENGLTSWFLKKAEFYNSQNEKRAQNEGFQKGDTYTWGWHNWDHAENGSILEANGKDYIVFTFDVSKVSVSLEERGEVVLVKLIQYDIPEDEEHKFKLHFGCSNGWTFWLTNLKAYVEHGILLNEKEIDLRGNELAGYVFVNM